MRIGQSEQPSFVLLLILKSDVGEGGEREKEVEGGLGEVEGLAGGTEAGESGTDAELVSGVGSAEGASHIGVH